MESQLRATEMRDDRSVDSRSESNQSSLGRCLWRSSDVVLGARLEITKKAVEHLSDLDHLADESQRIRGANGCHITRGDNVVLEFGRGIERYPQKAGVLAGTLLTAALDDIRWHRHRGSRHLAPKRSVLHSSDLPGDPVNIHR